MTHIPDTKPERSCRFCRWHSIQPPFGWVVCNNPGNMTDTERAIHGKRGAGWEGVRAEKARDPLSKLRCGKDGSLFELSLPPPSKPHPKGWIERAAEFFRGAR